MIFVPNIENYSNKHQENNIDNFWRNIILE